MEITFEYNHNGLRTKKTVKEGGVTTTYEYTLHGKLITHMTKRVDENGEETIENLHFDYDAQSRPAFVEYNGAKYRYVHDLQGDVVAIVDAVGNSVVEYKYDAWGKPFGYVLEIGISALNPFRYRGYVWDEETEFYYIKTRFYNGTHSRFISPDVIVDRASFTYKENRNVFGYCYNTPCVNVDCDGKGPILAIGAFVGKAALGGIANIISGAIYSNMTGTEYNLQSAVADFTEGTIISAFGMLAGFGGPVRILVDVMLCKYNMKGAVEDYLQDCVDAEQEPNTGTAALYAIYAGVGSKVQLVNGGNNWVGKAVDDVINGAADSMIRGASSHSYKEKNELRLFIKWVYDPLMGRERAIRVYRYANG